MSTAGLRLEHKRLKRDLGRLYEASGHCCSNEPGNNEQLRHEGQREGQQLAGRKEAYLTHGGPDFCHFAAWITGLCVSEHVR